MKTNTEKPDQKTVPTNCSNNRKKTDCHGVTLYERRLTYVQEPDTWDSSGNDQQLVIDTRDAGGGSYLVLATERWAIDRREIDGFCKMLKKSLEGLE